MELTATHTIVEKEDWFELNFPHRKLMVDLVKYHFPSRKFDPLTKTYRIDKSLSSKLADFALKHNFKFIDSAKHVQNWRDFPTLPQLQVNELDYIKRKLFPFQAEGVAYGLEKKGFMNGDDMGLGKTTQAIATACIANAFPTLVICPSSLKYNWQEEWETVAGKRSVILDDDIRRTWPNLHLHGGVDVFIVNYESLKKFFIAKEVTGANGRLLQVVLNDRVKMFKTIIVDEAHRIKDVATQQSRYTMSVTHFATYKVLLSGTFVVNNPKDLIVPLTITGALESEFGGEKSFIDTFYPGGRAQNLPELGFRLRRSGFYMRMKKDVLHDLPDKTRQIIQVEISNRVEYEKAERDFTSFLEEEGKSSDQITKAMRSKALILISVLKRISAKGKLQAVVDHIQDVIASGKKVIVFCWHIEIVRMVARAIPGSVTLTGEDTLEQRQGNKNRFQKDPIVPAIILNFQAGAVGHTLTAASLVLFIEFGWNPMHHDQAEDRAYRIGIKDNVLAQYVVGKNTVDEHIYNIIDRKRKVVQAITAGGDDIETSVLDDLINIYRKR